MKIYSIYRKNNISHNPFGLTIGAIVIAENEEGARKIHPSEYVTKIINGKWYGTYSNSSGDYETENDEYSSWVHVEDLDKIEVVEIGEAKKGSKKEVICASFHAG